METPFCLHWQSTTGMLVNLTHRAYVGARMFSVELMYAYFRASSTALASGNSFGSSLVVYISHLHACNASGQADDCEIALHGACYQSLAVAPNSHQKGHRV